MKTISSFNFTEIINDIKSGKVDSLCLVTAERYEDGEDIIRYIEDYEPYFAGTTEDEARECINAVAADVRPAEYEMIKLRAVQLHVTADDFADYDEECDIEENFISDFIDEHSDEFEEIGDSDWNERCVCYEYKSMKGGILLFWSWRNYVGYARKFARLEYCMDDITTIICKPIDRTFYSQRTLLVAPEEVQECKSASELRDLIQQRFDDMGLWDKDCNAEEFLREEYATAKRLRLDYLPENDLCDEE